MAAVASQPPRPGARRSPAGTPGPTHTPSSSISKGATARSAVSPRVNSSLAPGRRASLKAATPPRLNGETKESLADCLRRETDEKEQLLVQLQNKEQIITSLTTENDNLSSALNAAESRLTELYADQGRMEEEMAARIDIIEKLRSQVRDLEKEKRDLLRRYNEQTSTFEAERQAFYDNEQHLKSRIASLTQVRKQEVPTTSASEPELEAQEEEEEASNATKEAPQPEQQQDMNDPETEPAEMTALKLELSTLSTSYSSLQSTLVLLQSQLVDLKRVNRELQEENESYNILLTEKTLNGQFDLLKQVAAASASTSSDDEDDELPDSSEVDQGSLRSSARSRLDKVEEIAEEETLEAELERSLVPDESEAAAQSARKRGHRRGASTSSKSHSPGPRGESLADLPITGPGLDLAAELGRAENKDILEGNAIDDRDRSVVNGKPSKRSKKSSTEASRKASTSGDAAETIPTDLDTLRNEVKSLKDANKALSLYASKIIDRIIAQEGFEHVLAVDYEKLPPTPNPKSPGFTTFNSPPPPSKPRPQSAIFGFGTSSTADKSTSPTSPTPTATNPPNQPLNRPVTRNRRSLSFDWRSFSMFGSDKKQDVPTLRPLTLKPGSSAVTGARKLDTQEDEEDRRERERMIATMKLMGIEKPSVTPPPLIQKSISAPAPQPGVTSPTPSHNSSSSASRFSFFRSRSATTSDTSSLNSSSVQLGQPPLTQEALEQAEAENKLAALDAHERALSAEIAKGASGGYTEITRTRRSRRSHGDSGSTVWSAGMSKNGEDGDE
ncbi:hypothetical protein GLOTRDRAFT_124457 [Gloeophyllum trabeum ATCC 11539]|uniref:M protein, serotype 2.1 n=1 Tax=Gloeophyllum trabeum (strain ATCC 11539 / FP-39264 / Madison 617) TaxID=670483 RepID=S7S039_GLOTA|nr:uncharacterized protein GLOTRDRAFT_124457 [Gloeophyllum trabeum ATCC 11539]EPQ60705.1 hypothetical protein GLOTRDRAFT_124457 [Gloeophyllum trabeum ATCC 11539]